MNYVDVLNHRFGMLQMQRERWESLQGRILAGSGAGPGKSMSFAFDATRSIMEWKRRKMRAAHLERKRRRMRGKR